VYALFRLVVFSVLHVYVSLSVSPACLNVLVKLFCLCMGSVA